MKGLLVGMMMVTAGVWGQDGAMPKGAHPAYEVATIKLTPETDHNSGFHSDGNRMEVENETVKSMLMFAYGISAKQIVGQPGWVDETKYDVNGKPDTPGEPSTSQWQDVLKKLLADRYGLKAHREKRELAYFALRPSGALKIVRATGPDGGADSTGNGGAKGQTMKYTNVQISDFVIGIQYFLDRPVVDETGLNGKWDFTLRWMPEGRREGDVPVDAYPVLFTAMREQLGLKMENAKGPVEVLVVDSISRPSEN